MIRHDGRPILGALATSFLLVAGPVLAAPYPRFAFGSSGTGNGQFAVSQSLAISPTTGHVYASDQTLDRIQKFDGKGNYVLQWGSNGTGPGQFRLANGVAVDHLGHVYVCDFQNNRVQKFDANGNFLLQWGSLGTGNGQFLEPNGIAVNAANEVYVAEFTGNRVQKFTSNGTFLVKWGSAGAGNGQFNLPRDVAVDPAGNVFVCEWGNDRVQKFDANGTFLMKWGSLGSGNGQFTDPSGLGIDPAGLLYVSEFNGNRVQQFAPDGTFLTKWSQGSAGAFSLVTDVAARGLVYVNDFGNKRIQTFAFPAEDLALSDVPRDQGGQVRLRFAPASTDMPGSPEPITGYEAYRRIDGALAVSDPADEVDLANWDFVTTIPAHGESEYNVILPTLADSTAAGIAYSTFLVRATTADPYGYMDSNPESTYSVDNLAPPEPTNFAVLQVLPDGSVDLRWDPSSAIDFERFDLHRGTDPGFVPAAGNRIAQLTGTVHLDPQGLSGGSPAYYKLIARDDAGNPSPSAVTSTAIVGIGDGPGPALALRAASPARGVAHLSFDLPQAGRVSLSVHDVRGRRVWQGPRGAIYPAGTSNATWELRGSVPAGYYVARLVTAQGIRTAPVIVVE
jgi:DNA-binding beta-propeller fold protein YncE